MYNKYKMQPGGHLALKLFCIFNRDSITIKYPQNTKNTAISNVPLTLITNIFCLKKKL